ncbi:MAG: transcriptional regulator [Clostridiaceae bacterium]|mgnify:CR=1 FL=1|nr:transcriptional regulator [Clostridiaceae bacterium]
MFKVNDHIIYNTMGVCRVVDIRKEKDINDEETDFYILRPVYGNNLTIKTPINNDKVFMRKILKRDDVLSLIESLSDQETNWIDDNKKRNEIFKATLKKGETKGWAKLVKTIYIEKQEKSAIGKKLMKIDEDIMKTAEKNLYEEFAAALNISLEEVLPYIREHVS